MMSYAEATNNLTRRLKGISSLLIISPVTLSMDDLELLKYQPPCLFPLSITGVWLPRTYEPRPSAVRVERIAWGGGIDHGARSVGGESLDVVLS